VQKLRNEGHGLVVRHEEAPPSALARRMLPKGTMEHIHDPAEHRAGEALSRNTKLALLSAAVIVAFFVLREHWNHVLGLAPYLLLLMCPLMHLFGHGHHHGRHEH
jgi:hypothetical protein